MPGNDADGGRFQSGAVNRVPENPARIG